jgi:hypothetical protein
MIDFSSHKLTVAAQVDQQLLSSGCTLVVLHATRIPPHIGLIADDHYSSLTIKGRDIEVKFSALLKNINQRNIPVLFLHLKAHPIFSAAYLKEHFSTNVMRFEKVENHVATCLSPVKLFFEEVYDLSMREVECLHELVPLLEKENLLQGISSLNLPTENYQLPLYTVEDVEREIRRAKHEITKINN